MLPVVRTVGSDDAYSSSTGTLLDLTSDTGISNALVGPSTVGEEVMPPKSRGHLPGGGDHPHRLSAGWK
jgi:hypothetical protein